MRAPILLHTREHTNGSLFLNAHKRQLFSSSNVVSIGVVIDSPKLNQQIQDPLISEYVYFFQFKKRYFVIKSKWNCGCMKLDSSRNRWTHTNRWKNVVKPKLVIVRYYWAGILVSTFINKYRFTCSVCGLPADGWQITHSHIHKFILFNMNFCHKSIDHNGTVSIRYAQHLFKFFLPSFQLALPSWFWHSGKVEKHISLYLFFVSLLLLSAIVVARLMLTNILD